MKTVVKIQGANYFFFLLQIRQRNFLFCGITIYHDMEVCLSFPATGRKVSWSQYWLVDWEKAAVLPKGWRLSCLFVNWLLLGDSQPIYIFSLSLHLFNSLTYNFHLLLQVAQTKAGQDNVGKSLKDDEIKETKAD